MSKSIDVAARRFDSYAAIIGAVITRRREVAGVSQRKLAAMMGLYSPQICNLERGKHLPSLLLLAKLAKVLGTTPSAILREVEDLGGSACHP